MPANKSSRVRTWWGQEFLNTLTRFTEPERLKRGRPYASDKRLSHYKRVGSYVSATIEDVKNPYMGIYETPYYQVSIVFREFKEWEDLIAEITNHPLTLAKLSVGELPPYLTTWLPTDAHDIKAECSCPDYDNPCKHIAGLYYKLANEIDQNPLILFSLRGLDSELLNKIITTHLNYKSKSVVITSPQDLNRPKKLRDFWGSYYKIKTQPIPETIPCLLIKKAGIDPFFWHQKKPFIEMIKILYDQVNKNYNNKIN